MKISDHAEIGIGADFPEEPFEEGGEIYLRRGGAIAAAIAEILRRLGAEVKVEEPFGVEHGWELDIHYKGRNPWCEIQDDESCFDLHIDDRWADRWAALAGHLPQYVELIVLLNAELHRDPRFHDIRWYRRGDHKGRGPALASPVD